MRKTGRDSLSWLTSRSNEFVSSGNAIVDPARGDEPGYGMSLHIPPIMKVEDAIEQAPVVYTEIDEARSGTALLNLAEHHLRKIIDPEIFAERWPEGLSAYAGLEPERLQLLARRLVALGTSYPREMSAVSIMAYALLGLAEDRKFAESDEDHDCLWCYRTALSPSKYCAIHHISREARVERTKKRGSRENLDVARRHARHIRKIADNLWRNEQGIYNRLYRQLVGMTGGLNTLPPPLETLQDDEFATGARIGTNGGEWFIYLWKVLPRVQKVLGTDWPELVRSALEWKDWSRVLQRLGKIDFHKQDTDAFKWALTLIEAEEWAEAEEIERQQRCRGRPRKNHPDPRVEYALTQVHDGKQVAEVAQDLGVPVPTLYRWKAKTEPSTSSAVASDFQRSGPNDASLVAK